jgi:energy-coupling factor transporter transmembrane protein EcfT
MSSSLDYLYGPLSKKYCLFFYYLSVIGFVLLVFVVLYTVYASFSKKLPYHFYASMFSLFVIYSISYFQNRLLYSMCAASPRKEGLEDDKKKEEPTFMTE